MTIPPIQHIELLAEIAVDRILNDIRAAMETEPWPALRGADRDALGASWRRIVAEAIARGRLIGTAASLADVTAMRCGAVQPETMPGVQCELDPTHMGDTMSDHLAMVAGRLVRWKRAREPGDPRGPRCNTPHPSLPDLCTRPDGHAGDHAVTPDDATTITWLAIRQGTPAPSPERIDSGPAPDPIPKYCGARHPTRDRVLCARLADHDESHQAYVASPSSPDGMDDVVTWPLTPQATLCSATHRRCRYVCEHAPGHAGPHLAHDVRQPGALVQWGEADAAYPTRCNVRHPTSEGGVCVRPLGHTGLHQGWFSTMPLSSGLTGITTWPRSDDETRAPHGLCESVYPLDANVVCTLDTGHGADHQHCIGDDVLLTWRNRDAPPAAPETPAAVAMRHVRALVKRLDAETFAARDAADAALAIHTAVSKRLTTAQAASLLLEELVRPQ